MKCLCARRLVSGRKNFGGSSVRIEPDVAEILPVAGAVNGILRFLIKVAQINQLSAAAQSSCHALAMATEFSQ
jgi:hypothetical protein